MSSKSLVLVPTAEKEKNFHERFAFYKACYVLRELYIMNLQEHCYCKKFEGPELSNGKYYNCNVCKASIDRDFFDLESIKEDIFALRRLFKRCEMMNFSIVMGNVVPFWLKKNYNIKSRSDDALTNLMNYIFVFRSQLILTLNVQCSKAKFQKSASENTELLCCCPICHFCRQWNMFELRASMGNFQQLKILHESCLKTCVDLMMYGNEPHWLHNPDDKADEKELNESLNSTVLFCFRL